MTRNVLHTDTYQQQIAKYHAEIETLTQRATFDDANIQYLPKSTICSLTQ
jgi:cell division protein FtsB